METPDKPLRVAQYHPVWLPQTMTWLHRQVRELEPYCDQVILCEKTELKDQFGVSYLKSLSDINILCNAYHRLNKKIGLTKNLKYFEDTLRNHSTQLLHSHFGHVGVSGSKLAETMGIPHIVTFYGMDISQIPKSKPKWIKQYNEMFSSVSRVLCEGPFMAKSIENLGCSPDKITVHPLGVHLESIEYEARSRLPGESIKILMTGSFRQKKGFPLALEAVAALSKQIDVRVTLVGDASDDHDSQLEKKRINEVITRHKMHQIVHQTGFLPHDEVFKLAKSHHIFLSPSIHAENGDCEGGAPVSIIEMAASGMIVVSSEHCDIPGVISHFETGYLAIENDLPDLIKQLKNAIRDIEKWPEISAAARKFIEAKFDSKKQAKRLFEIYSEVING